MTETATKRPIFAILALSEGTPLAVHGLFEVFHSVGRTWQEMTGEANVPYEIAPKIVASKEAPIETGIGISIAPQGTLCDADVVIVPDIQVDADFDPKGRWKAECEWIRSQYEAGAIICSVCTGSLVLAEAGLMKGQSASCHWAAIELFRVHYPDVKLAPERILTAAGEADRIVTSGGASSWEDLALYLIARFAGGEEAVRISKIFLFGERSEGQLMFAGAKPAHRHADAKIAEIQVWVADHYHEENPVSAMISRSGMIERTFNRRFRAATGYSPIEYVQTLRIEEAKQLLETSRLGIEDISSEIGYANPAYFRKLFKRRTGVSPARYRQRFAPIAKLSNQLN